MAPGDQRRTGRGRKRPALRVAVVDGRGRPLDAAPLRRWLERVAPASARGTVTLALVPDARVRALNRTYRRKDYATDVLSFPADPHSPPRRIPRTRRAKPSAVDLLSVSSVSPVVDRFLGDIVIATGVARRQARDAGHHDQTELRILALHGLLHLLGYDHERDGGRMARVERRLRREGGLREGLIERAGGSVGLTTGAARA